MINEQYKRLSSLFVEDWFREKELSFFKDNNFHYWVYEIINETNKAICISIKARYYDENAYSSEPPTSALFLTFNKWIPKSLIKENVDD